MENFKLMSLTEFMEKKNQEKLNEDKLPSSITIKPNKFDFNGSVKGGKKLFFINIPDGDEGGSSWYTGLYVANSEEEAFELFKKDFAANNLKGESDDDIETFFDNSLSYIDGNNSHIFEIGS